ncbi:MAG TPA: alpha/beta fold hydrolase [Puia sp.]|jgi:pimeloyl-ACP methyl ester carboxylesterase|nr:alpha/beta fold hydrolase [Puia sp.]
MFKKKLIRWAKVLILLYCIIGIAWYYGQEKLLFHPVAVDRKTAYTFHQPFTELNIPYDAASNLNVIQFHATDRPADSLPKGVVLYFHGNTGGTSTFAPASIDFTAKGYEVWMLDYPGFGKSTGAFSEKKLYEYALVYYKLARSRWSPGQIILYGRSMGTGIAAQLAAVRDCRRLILESPAYSLTSVARRYLFLYPVSSMLHYHFPTNEYLPAVTAPITIFQGDQDRTVPYSNASRLKPLLKKGDEFVTVQGAGHNDLRDQTPYREKLDSVLAL